MKKLGRDVGASLRRKLDDTSIFTGTHIASRAAPCSPPLVERRS